MVYRSAEIERALDDLYAEIRLRNDALEEAEAKPVEFVISQLLPYSLYQTL